MIDSKNIITTTRLNWYPYSIEAWIFLFGDHYGSSSVAPKIRLSGHLDGPEQQLVVGQPKFDLCPCRIHVRTATNQSFQSFQDWFGRMRVTVEGNFIGGRSSNALAVQYTGHGDHARTKDGQPYLPITV